MEKYLKDFVFFTIVTTLHVFGTITFSLERIWTTLLIWLGRGDRLLENVTPCQS